MQTAPRQAAEAPKPPPIVVEKPAPRRRSIKLATWAVIGLIGLIALGTMLANLPVFGVWPPKIDTTEQRATFAPPTPYASGLLVAKAGDPRKEGDQIFVPVKVTNHVLVPLAAPGTPTPGAATPTPSAANVLNGIVRVLFYDAQGNSVGNGIGNVVNLPYGQTTTIQVVATGVGDYARYEVSADRVWTDKDVVKPTTAPSP